MARMKPDVLDEFLKTPIISVLATVRRNGMPYQVPVWFLWRDGAFWLTGTYTRVWCKHLLVDPRASLCIEDRDPVAKYVAVECTVEAVEPKNSDIWATSQLLVEKYVPPGGVAAFMANMKTEPRLLFRLTPHQWRAIDLTVYVGSKGDLAYQRANQSEPA
jgi:PPOX class probable F420-dependent enzyme